MPIFVDPSVVAPPPPETVVSTDGLLTATINTATGGVLLSADLSGVSPAAVRFYRNGVPIASGHDAAAPGGLATAFDYYVPHDKVLTYYAAPIVDGEEGAPTESVATVLPSPSRPREIWIKSWTDPALSFRPTPIVPLPEFEEEARLNLQAVPGARFAAGSRDIHLAPTTAFQFLTETPEERRRMSALLRSGPLYFAFRGDVDVDDFWALAGNLSSAMVEPDSRESARVWTVELTQTAPPPTLGAPLVLPGRSYADLAEQVATYGHFASLYDTYGQYLGA